MSFTEPGDMTGKRKVNFHQGSKSFILSAEVIKNYFKLKIVRGVLISLLPQKSNTGEAKGT